MIEKHKKLRSFLLAMVVGSVLTLMSLAYVHEPPTLPLKNCDKMGCLMIGMSVSRETSRGFPFDALKIERNVLGDKTTIVVDYLGVIIDWLLYSSISFVMIAIVKRCRHQKR